MLNILQPVCNTDDQDDVFKIIFSDVTKPRPEPQKILDSFHWLSHLL